MIVLDEERALVLVKKSSGQHQLLFLGVDFRDLELKSYGVGGYGSFLDVVPPEHVKHGRDSSVSIVDRLLEDQHFICTKICRNQVSPVKGSSIGHL